MYRKVGNFRGVLSFVIFVVDLAVTKINDNKFVQALRDLGGREQPRGSNQIKTTKILLLEPSMKVIAYSGKTVCLLVQQTNAVICRHESLVG